MATSYAHVGCASVLLGGAGVVFLGGGFEAIRNGYPMGWLGVFGGLGLWLLLAFLYWLTFRANRRRAWVERQPYSHFAGQSLKRGGFWRGFLWTWGVVIAVHALVFLVSGFAELLPHPDQVRGLMMLIGLVLLPAHLVLPILGGTVWSLLRSTSLR
ncbi:hypothetical protein [Pseudoxanthomonas sp. Root630]|uniref:hypothetical protein n=1 Tax=Pseudoxanthomonas sp. Root630 TaxID=1736574 RepID=UPI00071526F8|nr:hypothetical protein [Pseudoxanthomonas sp. Root630]KRA46696.1 hypothetical protein ASD72_05790 [Pseudoxanthomonas sp. Root630]